MTAVISLQDLTLGYDRHPAVHHLDIQIEAGTLTAIVGPNGSGKSTLLKGVMGALAPLSGQIDMPSLTPRDIAYLPQQSEIDRSFPLSVQDLVGMGLWREVGAWRGLSRSHRARITSALSAVGLEGFRTRTIGSLSGGQMQRVLFARLLLQEAEVLLLDEPFTAIDAPTVEDLIGVIHRWHGEGRTVIAVLHDFDIVKTHFPQTLMLAREPVAFGETSTVLTAANQLHARSMAEAPDPQAGVCQRRTA